MREFFVFARDGNNKSSMHQYAEVVGPIVARTPGDAVGQLVRLTGELGDYYVIDVTGMKVTATVSAI